MGTQSTWGLISRVSSRTYRSFGLLNNPTSKNIKMVFKKFVEIGRVVYVIDSNHIIIDAPNVNRSKINLKRVELTKFRCEFLHGARTKTVNKAWAAADIDGQWAGSNWAKTLAKKALRASANDFQRFKVMKLKQARREIINKQK